jgi:XTP/dITP diphosphohydrolase
MAGLQGASRHAFYIAVVVLLRDAQDPTPLIAEGRWHGSIADAPRGKGGFGYDPIFVPEGGSLHAAELSSAEKNRVSHRAKAINSLLARAND